MRIGASSTGKRHLVTPGGHDPSGRDTALCGAEVHGEAINQYTAAEIWWDHNEFGQLVDAGHDPEGIGRLCRTCWNIARDKHPADLRRIYELADEAGRGGTL
jgi:hypothetical protein